jgi:hypothetical protein
LRVVPYKELDRYILNILVSCQARDTNHEEKMFEIKFIFSFFFWGSKHILPKEKMR